jgi:O-antigen/teichoic acid export membrane protein
VLAPYRPRFSLSSGAVLPLFRFGRWLFLAGVLAIAADVFLRAVVSRRLGAIDLGIYYVAARVAMLPYEVINELIGAVIFPVQARLQQDKPRAARVFRASLKATAAFLILVYALLAALAASLVTILGPRWTTATSVIQILALVGLTGALWEPTTAMFQGFGRSAWIAALYGIRLPVLIGLSWTLSGRFGLTGAAVAWVLAELTAHAGAAVLTKRLIPQPFVGMIRPLTAIASAAVAAAAIAVVVDQVLPALWGLAVAGLLGVGVGIGVLSLLDRALHAGLWSDITKIFPGLAHRFRIADQILMDRNQTRP